MTYTAQQLQAMSDFEVNKALAEKLLAQYEHSESQEKKDLYCGLNGSMGSTYRYRDYCSSYSDIMTLAFERGIKLDCVACPAGSGFVYYAKSYDGKLQSDYDSVCRAIACLLLMMED